MEFEQIIKRLEWLDKQQRQNQDSLTKLDARLASFETTVEAVSKQIQILSKQITEIKKICLKYLQKSDVIVLGCTEFAIMLKDENLPMIDTVDILVEATLDRIATMVKNNF